MVNNLKFKYKGTRNYVHGTDIFIKIIDVINKEVDINDRKVNIDMTIYKVTRNCMDISDAGNSRIDQKPNVVFNITDNDNLKKTFFLFENNETVTESYEYDEEKIIARARFNDNSKTISTDSLGESNFIENVVALNKGLLGYLYSNEALVGKWYFTKIRLRDFNFTSTTGVPILELSLKKNMDFRLTDSEIKLNGNPIGNIYFSLV